MIPSQIINHNSYCFKIHFSNVFIWTDARYWHMMQWDTIVKQMSELWVCEAFPTPAEQSERTQQRDAAVHLNPGETSSSAAFNSPGKRNFYEVSVRYEPCEQAGGELGRGSHWYGQRSLFFNAHTLISSFREESAGHKMNWALIEDCVRVCVCLKGLHSTFFFSIPEDPSWHLCGFTYQAQTLRIFLHDCFPTSI